MRGGKSTTLLTPPEKSISYIRRLGRHPAYLPSAFKKNVSFMIQRSAREHQSARYIPGRLKGSDNPLRNHRGLLREIRE